jgi:hypothetical protein
MIALAKPAFSKSAGEPDLVSVEGNHCARPPAHDEVADSSLDYGHDVKLPLYARYCIPEVWLVDLVHRCVEVYRDSDGKRYRAVNAHRAGRIACAQVPAAWLQVEDLFGR